MTEGRRLSAIVLAAGQGTRMKSARPKPLHRLCGRTMVGHVLGALPADQVERAVVVVGHGGDEVRKVIAEEEAAVRLEFVEQKVQRGTGDAVLVGLSGLSEDELDDEEEVLVLPGDTPLLTRESIDGLLAAHRESGAACTVLTARFVDPTGYGRIVRGRDDRVMRIVEQRDATPAEAEIDEINTGIFCFRRSILAPALRRLGPENSQGEYYLTDVVEVLAEMGYSVTSRVADDPDETHGVNDRRQLAAAEAELRRRNNDAWMARGVTMLDPDQTYLDVTVELAEDVTIYPGVVLQGRTVVGPRSKIGAGCRLVDCIIGSDSTVKQTEARRATIGDDAHVGPYASLDPGSEVASGTRTGPFYTSSGTDQEGSH
ncbi:MAG TPA: bifunctional UDP-N-acetylglucosamine diphosphorylase/glucosamine-1-phosphate N-acetyltransferase GlmU [Acidimicrobiales bacterium]|nr:bifunctional UDP-N-acetylglucosamine diphosphorylase/glucosamine-1-phosphate N-acetyltransferase GlmU [Acidimicrobiales bacterium]